MVSNGPGLVAGAVLCGGSSRRMGRDKATIQVDGDPLVAHVARAVADASCAPLALIGGAPGLLDAVADIGGVTHVPDRFPGEGPLGGVISGLSWLTDGCGVAGRTTPDWLLVVACDLARLDVDTVNSIVGCAADDLALGRSATPPHAVFAGTDRIHYLCAAWHMSALPALRVAFDGGVRSMHEAAGHLAVRTVQVAAAAMINVNSPADLQRLSDATS
jgi:molybdenum cofactor guanylyltransferase